MKKADKLSKLYHGGDAIQVAHWGKWGQKEVLEILQFENLIGWNTECFLSFGVKIHPVCKANMDKTCLHLHLPKYIALQNNSWTGLQGRRGKSGEERGMHRSSQVWPFTPFAQEPQ